MEQSEENIFLLTHSWVNIWNGGCISKTAKKKYRLKWRNSIRNSHQCAIPSQNKRRTNDTNEKEKMENRNSFYIVAKPHVVYFILIRRKFPYKFHNSIQYQWSFYRLSKKFQQNWIQKAKISYKETYRFFFLVGLWFWSQFSVLNWTKDKDVCRFRHNIHTFINIFHSILLIFKFK